MSLTKKQTQKIKRDVKTWSKINGLKLYAKALEAENLKLQKTIMKLKSGETIEPHQAKRAPRKRHYTASLPE